MRSVVRGPFVRIPDVWGRCNVVLNPTTFCSPTKSFTFQVLVATVEEKENAAKQYQSAVAQGTFGGLVQQDSRNSNQVGLIMSPNRFSPVEWAAVEL